MKNLDVLNTCYRYINRFINSDELIEQLNKAKEKLNGNEKNNVDELIKEIIEISNSIPNEEDELIIREKETIKKIMRSLEQIPQDEGNKEFLTRQLETLKKDYDKKHDSHKKWLKIMNNITSNEYFNNCYDSLSEQELLNFITEYINVPIPPLLTQEEFDKLVKLGIENNLKEQLYRLAFNYAKKKINLDSIFDYFILKNDGYYISELISAIGEYLDIDNIIDKINDKELIEDLSKRKIVMADNISDKQWDKLISKLEDESSNI